MGRYGITIKNPDFKNFGFLWSENNKSSLEEEFIKAKAELIASILTDFPDNEPKSSKVWFKVSLIKGMIFQKVIFELKDRIENDTIYLDIDSTSDFEYEISNWEKMLNDDLTELLVACIISSDKIIDTKDPEYIINSARVYLDKQIDNITETMEYIVSYKLALFNKDNIVKDNEAD